MSTTGAGHAPDDPGGIGSPEASRLPDAPTQASAPSASAAPRGDVTAQQDALRSFPLTRYTLEMLERPRDAPRPLPDRARVDLAQGMTPEFLRFLHAAVGGPWHWTGRLAWTREQWLADISDPMTEIHVISRDGVPLGYAQLQAQPGGECEIRYFGLIPEATGCGLGGIFLERVTEAAWTVGERLDGARRIRRVWLRTTSHDAPSALANYRARGFRICETREDHEERTENPLGSWRATGGPPG